MKPRKELPKREFLNECFNYDPDTGSLTWKTRPVHHFTDEYLQRRSNTRWAGKEAGSKALQGSTKKPSCIYVNLFLDGKVTAFVAHRIIYAMLGFDLPEGMVIDHINGNAWDNRLDNLRVCTHSENLTNSAKYRRPNASGLILPKGVSFTPNRRARSFRAILKGRVENSKKNIHLGYFDTPEEAHEAWKAASLAQNGEFHRSA